MTVFKSLSTYLMSKPYFILCTVLLLCTSAFSQDVIRLQECNSPAIKNQVDSLKALLAKDGFTVMKEASITMESEYEMPVIVPDSWNYSGVLVVRRAGKRAVVEIAGRVGC